MTKLSFAETIRPIFYNYFNGSGALKTSASWHQETGQTDRVSIQPALHFSRAVAI
jgi:hypothetical protein